MTLFNYLTYGIILMGIFFAILVFFFPNRASTTMRCLAAVFCLYSAIFFLYQERLILSAVFLFLIYLNIYTLLYK